MEYQIQQPTPQTREFGIVRIGAEPGRRRVSGASRDGRPELETIIEFLRAGDELLVTRLDRLGRDVRDVLNIVT